MPRIPNTDCNECAFSNETVALVWSEASIIPPHNSAVFRQDRCGAWIKRDEYGKETEYGWHIDHDRPVSKGGTDDFDNLQPLHWRNNLGKGADFPSWSCTVSAS